MNENIMEIERILSEYDSQKDLKFFADSITELYEKGVAKGCYQDTKILCDIVSILTRCQNFIKNNIKDNEI